MKRAWNIISFLAVVNMLTLIFVIAWLWQTDRIDDSRLGELKRWFSTPIDQETDAETGVAVVNVGLEPGANAFSSEERLAWYEHWRMESEQRLQRLVDEAERRGLEVQARLGALEDERQALEEQRSQLELESGAAASRNLEDAFARTVRLYESARPATAKAWILGLIEEGRMDRAVEYLSAMNSRSAGKVLETLDEGNEVQLATQLLEAMSSAGSSALSEELPGNVHARTEPDSTP